jgi:hypothetical protein
MYHEMIWSNGPMASRTVTSSGQQGADTLAQELGIRVLFVAVGMTGVYQPLDPRIFGSLKARARAWFDRL